MKKLYSIRLSIAIVVLLAAILAFFGLYEVYFLDVQFAPLVSKLMFDFSIGALVLFISIFILTLIFGRFYCSILCPFGISQEVVRLVIEKVFKKKNSTPPSLPYKYFIAAIAWGVLFSGSAFIFNLIDPYKIFGSFMSLSLYGIVLALIVYVIVFYKNRFFCSNICPVGALLGLISKISIFKINKGKDCINCGMCQKVCPQGAIKKTEDGIKISQTTCIRCFRCISACPKDTMNYGIKPKEVDFDLTKRNLITSACALGVFALAWGAGVKFIQSGAQKLKNIILPPGAIDQDTIKARCINCNLCVQNCPNGIISKSNSQFSAPHLDYTKGEGYCDYKCNKCSQVCPQGAIKKITLDKKQNTRIAMAAVNKSCVGCYSCISSCPKAAIHMEGYSAKIDGTKCIGCGKCQSLCPYHAIDIFGINKQTML